MCRLTVYKGRPILIGDIVITPENSLLYQSRDAAYHPGVLDNRHQRNILVNGDGFGISWYGEKVSKGSCCFKFVTPAWSDTNLRNIGRHVSSQLIFAHVRAAASGHNPFEPMIVSNENCHPFTYKEYTFMHNGGIPSFQSIKLQILKLLSPETFANIKGTTDTEHIFAIYLNCLPSKQDWEVHTVAEMVDAMNRTISTVLQLCAENGIREHCSLNLCVTNGVHVIATRFRTGPKSPPSLYYNFGSSFVCREGNFYAQDEGSTPSEIVISSAPLSKVCCPLDQSGEYEHDVSYTEEGDPISTVNTPTSRGTPAAANALRHASAGTARLSSSSGSPRSLQQHIHATPRVGQDDTGASDSGSDSDVGSWILIPKNHMLVCTGDPAAPQRVVGICLEPIVVSTSITPLSYPLTPRKRKDGHCNDSSEAQWQATPGADQPLSGGGDPAVPLAKRRATASSAPITTRGEEDCGALSAALLGGAAASPPCTATVFALASPQSCSAGVVFSPACKQKPRVMKFTCKGQQ